MKRREFITLLGGGVAAWPLAARAQQGERTRRIGVLMLFAETDPQSLPRVSAFEQGLAKLGWTVGRNLRIDYRWSINVDERARAATMEVLKLAPDVILAHARPALAAMQQATRAVPIEFTTVNEPVAQGFVQSLAHPGGNITGFSYLEPTLGAKWLELLKEIAPDIQRAAIMFSPDTTTAAYYVARGASSSSACQV
jgi:putative tryptophan/tyrosine transport system substrate-binding protein